MLTNVMNLHWMRGRKWIHLANSSHSVRFCSMFSKWKGEVGNTVEKKFSIFILSLLCNEIDLQLWLKAHSQLSHTHIFCLGKIMIKVELSGIKKIWAAKWISHYISEKQNKWKFYTLHIKGVISRLWFWDYKHIYNRHTSGLV